MSKSIIEAQECGDTDVPPKGMDYHRGIVDPQKPSGLVMTQIMSGGSHVMYHPVFKALSDEQKTEITPDGADKLFTSDEKSKEESLKGLTTVIFNKKLLDPSATTDGYRTVDMLRGFVGVCVSNTMVTPETGRPKAKRRKREEPRMTLAVSGTVTLPWFAGPKNTEDDGSTIVPGDLVAFSIIHSPRYLSINDNATAGDWITSGSRKEFRVLTGTEDSEHPEYIPRIRKFDDAKVYSKSNSRFYQTCSAPFGVCVGIDEEAGQITVLLRLDLYHSHYYDTTQKDNA
jgi:hypothetical protein